MEKIMAKQPIHSRPVRKAAGKKVDQTTIPLKPKPDLENPGSIIAEKTLTLHTKESLKIFKGRRADQESGVKDIPGLSIYGTMLRHIWGCALSGDLYAQFWIQKLEMNLKNTEADYRKVHEELEALKAKVAGQIDLSKSEATDPVPVNVSYSTPYMYLIIYRLIELDTLIATLITLRHIAIINPAQFDHYRKNIVASMQNILNGLRRFKSTGVILDDVKDGNARYQKAVSEHGELPDDIKSGKYVPEHMPRKSIKILGFGSKKS